MMLTPTIMMPTTPSMAAAAQLLFVTTMMGLTHNNKISFAYQECFTVVVYNNNMSRDDVPRGRQAAKQRYEISKLEYETSTMCAVCKWRLSYFRHPSPHPRHQKMLFSLTSSLEVKLIIARRRVCASHVSI